jgi:hypothetical protein
MEGKISRSECVGESPFKAGKKPKGSSPMEEKKCKPLGGPGEEEDRRDAAYSGD